MKILLSAYACEPDKGSEPGVGWNWALELAKLDYKVWVLTRANNRQAIEKELARHPAKPNLHFIYFDLPIWARKLKKLPGGIYLYYTIWQLKAYQFVKQYHYNLQFDVVHHVTFVSIRLPSFMGRLPNTRFIFGPLAGGEKTPWRLRKGYPVRGIILDILRDLGNFFIRFDPLIRSSLRKADIIYVTSPQTKELIPEQFHCKTRIKLAIGLSEKWLTENVKISPQESSVFKILFVGRFLYWKGMHLGFQAISEVVKSYPNIQLTMVGDGPEKHVWKKQALHLGIESKINWVPWVSKPELIRLYKTHQLFLFPSLHDSGGMVVLEALAHGLPVVCLDLGGPGVIVDDSCGIKLPVKSKTHNDIIDLLANGIKNIISKNLVNGKSKNDFKERAEQFNWSNITIQIYN